MIEVADFERGEPLRALSGEPDAARWLIDETGPLVYGFIYARVGGRQDVAEDLVQATYLEAMRSAQTFRGEAALGTWLCSIARRQVARYFKGERRRAILQSRLRLVEVEAESEEESREESLAESDALIGGLGRLPPLQRQALVLKYLEGLSVDEIASELSRSSVQVQSLLQRARAGLRRALEEESCD